jgi:hypothetical protein
MKRQRAVLRSGLVAVALVAALGTAVLAQPAAPPPPVRILVTTTYVKPDMVVAFQDLQRTEAVPANKKAGVPWRWVFANTVMSGDGFTFTTVSPVTNFAQFDQPNAIQRALGADGAAKYNAKIRPMILRQHQLLQTLQQDLSLQSFSTTLPALAIVTTLELIPGKNAEFVASQRDDYLPALKKAGVSDYLVFNTNYGGPQGQRSIVQYLPNYAAFDQPNAIQRALGQEGAQKLNQRRQAIITRSENAVYRLIPDLSYGAPARPK